MLRVLAMAATTAALGCSSTSENKVTDGTPDASSSDVHQETAIEADAIADDATPTDAKTEDANGPDVGVTLLLHEPFEGQPSCGNWNPIGGTALTTTTQPYAGFRSCKICVGSGELVVIKKPTTALSENGTFTLTAFVRSDGDTGVAWQAQIILNASDGGPPSYVSSAGATATKWTLIQAVGTPKVPPVSYTIEVLNKGGPGACLYLDELEVTVQP